MRADGRATVGTRDAILIKRVRPAPRMTLGINSNGVLTGVARLRITEFDDANCARGRSGCRAFLLGSLDHRR